MSLLSNIQSDIHAAGNPEKGMFSQRFFKTGEGEYGYGDIFLGLTVPQSRLIAKKYKDLPLADVKELLVSPYHEERLIALFLLVSQYKRNDQKGKKEIYNFYLSHTAYINNWDLVDSSAGYIVGDYLEDKDRRILRELAKSESLWERRIAIISTYAFIHHGEYDDTFQIAEILLHDTEDLIHKAVGWMLREVGKRINQEVEEEFLKMHYKSMPRTMLRYAIEHFPEDRRKQYLFGTI